MNSSDVLTPVATPDTTSERGLVWGRTWSPQDWTKTHSHAQGTHTHIHTHSLTLHPIPGQARLGCGFLNPPAPPCAQVTRAGSGASVCMLYRKATCGNCRLHRKLHLIIKKKKKRKKASSFLSSTCSVLTRCPGSASLRTVLKVKCHSKHILTKGYL